MSFRRSSAIVPTDADGVQRANPTAVATQVSCYAIGYTDPPSTSVPTSLAQTFAYAGTLFDASHTALASWLQSNYGIFPAFSGIGYSVKDSYRLNTAPMTSQQILVKSVSSEYVSLKTSRLPTPAAAASPSPPTPTAPTIALIPISSSRPEATASANPSTVCKDSHYPLNFASTSRNVPLTFRGHPLPQCATQLVLCVVVKNPRRFVAVPHRVADIECAAIDSIV